MVMHWVPGAQRLCRGGQKRGEGRTSGRCGEHRHGRGKRTRERKAWRLEKSREAEKTEADIGEGEKQGEQRSKREIVESQREDRDRRSGSQDD